MVHYSVSSFFPVVVLWLIHYHLQYYLQYKGKVELSVFRSEKKKKEDGTLQAKFIGYTITTHLAAILQYLNDSVFRCSVCLLEK